tara:strand:+ start:336 stop:956 length:621 start_codon:yes stop_codon:yes gene_type:complete
VDLYEAIQIGFISSFIMGPVFWSLLETSILKGFKAAVFFDIGVIIADICFLAVCFLGSVQLKKDDANSQGLYILGGTILIVYGVFMWINRRKKNRKKLKIKKFKENYFGLIAKGFAINILNVGVLIYWGAIALLQKPEEGQRLSSFVLFFSVVLITYFITDLVKIYFANRFKNILTGKGIVIVNTVMSLILVGIGAYFILFDGGII